jgi:hypothetical protein
LSNNVKRQARRQTAANRRENFCFCLVNLHFDLARETRQMSEIKLLIFRFYFRAFRGLIIF